MRLHLLDKEKRIIHLGNLSGRIKGDMKCNGFICCACCCCCWTKMLVANCCWIVCQNNTWSAKRGGTIRCSSSGFGATEGSELTLVSSEAETFPAWSALETGRHDPDSECVRMWALKLQASAKHFPHCEQLWGFFPVKSKFHQHKIQWIIYRQVNCNVLEWTQHICRYYMLRIYLYGGKDDSANWSACWILACIHCTGMANCRCGHTYVISDLLASGTIYCTSCICAVFPV